MELLDTQIISYKFKGNRELYDGDILGRQIPSIVALEFLGIMEKNKNAAKMYPFTIKGMHPGIRIKMEHRKRGFELGRNVTDRMILDFNGEFDSIVIFSNEAIAKLINEKDSESLLMFAQQALGKEDLKMFRERLFFILDNDITVIPVTQRIAEVMFHLYAEIRNDYNVKDNYRNSFMDLLILATAFDSGNDLITMDKELNRVMEKCHKKMEISSISKNICKISFCIETKEGANIKNDNKGYVNNGWRAYIQKVNNGVIV